MSERKLRRGGASRRKGTRVESPRHRKAGHRRPYGIRGALWTRLHHAERDWRECPPVSPKGKSGLQPPVAQAWSSPSLTWLCSSFTGFFLRQTRSELSKAPSSFSPLCQPLHHECSKACSAIIPLLRWGKLRLSMSPKLSPGRISSGNIGTQIQVCAEPQLLTSTQAPWGGSCS